MDGGPKEIELKLRVAPEDIAALKNHPNFADAFRNSTHEALDSIYFDSDDLFLRDHGLSLRVRHIGDKRVQTIKTVNQGSDWFERSEWEQSIDGDQPDLTRAMDTALGPILTDDVRHALKPIFETRIARTAYHLNGNDTAITMALDEGQIVGTDSSCPVSEIELELEHGNPAELFKIARAINDVVPAQLDVKSKSERGYELIEKTPVAAEKAYDPKLKPGMSTGQAFTVTKNRQSEALHQMRVALRRLRAAMSLFSNIVRDDRINAIKNELRWLAREFAALVALGVLIALPAGAGQLQSNASPPCDNDARCTNLNVAPTSGISASERKPRRAVDANGNIMLVTVQTAYGFNITVHPAYASKFQKFFALLKERGYKVPANIIKCWAPRGTRVAGSNHYIGAACDIQTGWNRGPEFVYHMSDIVKQAGLYNGCSFHDCGHVEAIRGTHNRAPNLYTAMEKFKSEQSTANYQP